MAVQNRIVKIQKRNRALVRFDETRIPEAILRAAESIGGFQQDFLPIFAEAGKLHSVPVEMFLPGFQETGERRSMPRTRQRGRVLSSG